MLKRTNSLTTILILQQIQIQPQQPEGEEDRQKEELHRVMIFRQLKALPSEELESRIFKSGIIYIYITNTKQLCYYIINNYVYHELKNDV